MSAAVAARLRARIARALDDPELPALTPGLDACVAFEVGEARVGLRFADGAARLADDADAPDIVARAGADAWTKAMQAPPPPLFQSFAAMLLANPAFEVTGDRVALARALPGLERIVARLAPTPPAAAPPAPRDLGQIAGRYAELSAPDGVFDVFVESAGAGPPVLLLHTAGADARQFHGQLADVELARDWRFVAPDMPFHGRSCPPLDWDGGPYRLTGARYLGWCVAILEQIVREKAIIAGCSMGAAMALTLAAERPDLVRGVVAIEPPFQSRGRRNPCQHHVGVHAGLHNAAYVRGLMSPTSPAETRRRAAWIYAQGAPGVYAGDLGFYSDEFDGALVAPHIDAARTPVALLCGAYDYSASPEHGAALARRIPGARMTVMPRLGHFPMIEHPDLFRPYFVEALRRVGGA